MCVVWQASGKTGIIKSVISSLPENKIFGHFLCRVRADLFTEALRQHFHGRFNGPIKEQIHSFQHINRTLTITVVAVF
jgi:hypothetical protein